MEDNRVLVVGAGAMGSAIAWLAARGGYAVDVVEPDDVSRERARERIRRNAEKAADDAAERRIDWYGAVPEGSAAFVAIEAVPERFELKRDVFIALDSTLASGAMLATNTSSLSVGDLAGVVSEPQRVLGLHFFNPPEAMKLVEVVRAPETSDDTIERARSFVERIGRTAVVAADTPGFIVNRVARPYYLQSLRALDRGAASAEELDALARAAGFRMGPFELMDLIGLDVNVATSESIYARTGAERLAPVDLQRTMVQQGFLGRKTGQGFYRYGPGGSAPEKNATPAHPVALTEASKSERLAVVGFGSLAEELEEMLGQRYDAVQRVENEDLLDELAVDSTIVFDAGDGTSDRAEIIAQLDGLLDEECIFFVDAYTTDLAACARRMRHPERLVGYGVLGSFASQQAIEIVDTAFVSDEALAVAQELFESLGKRTVLLEDVPALFLGRVVGSIVSEAVGVVHEEIASPDDVDVAMRLGTNYPIGPLAWGREIGGARLTRILQRLAQAEGAQFAPHRALWVLDVDPEAESERGGPLTEVLGEP